MKVITPVVGELGTNCYLLIDEAHARGRAHRSPPIPPDELSPPSSSSEGVTLRYILLTTTAIRDPLRSPQPRHAQCAYPAAAVYIHPP